MDGYQKEYCFKITLSYIIALDQKFIFFLESNTWLEMENRKSGWTPLECHSSVLFSSCYCEG